MVSNNSSPLPSPAFSGVAPSVTTSLSSIGSGTKRVLDHMKTWYGRRAQIRHLVRQIMKMARTFVEFSRYMWSVISKSSRWAERIGDPALAALMYKVKDIEDKVFNDSFQVITSVTAKMQKFKQLQHAEKEHIKLTAEVYKAEEAVTNARYHSKKDEFSTLQFRYDESRSNYNANFAYFKKKASVMPFELFREALAEMVGCFQAKIGMLGNMAKQIKSFLDLQLPRDRPSWTPLSKVQSLPSSSNITRRRLGLSEMRNNDMNRSSDYGTTLTPIASYGSDVDILLVNANKCSNSASNKESATASPSRKDLLIDSNVVGGSREFTEYRPSTSPSRSSFENPSQDRVLGNMAYDMEGLSGWLPGSEST